MSRNLRVPEEEQEKVNNVPMPTEEQEEQTKVVEVPINLELINNKLNYIISILERFKK